MYINNPHHQIILTAENSLTLFHHPFLLPTGPGQSSRMYLVSIQS